MEERVADIFLSYSRKDRQSMQNLRQALEQSGFKVWTDETGLEVGTPSWTEAIEQAIQSTLCMVVLLSPNAKRAQWVTNEILYAQQCDRRVFPVLIAGEAMSAVPISLIATQYIDLSADFEKQFEQLVEDISQHLQKPILPASTPFQLVVPPEPDFQVEDWVFGYWEPDQCWYPAQVRRMGGERIYIRFADGTKQWNNRDQVLPNDLEPGDFVECRYKGRPYYYPAHIMQLESERLLVEYDYENGSDEDPSPREQEWTSLEMVRVTR